MFMLHYIISITIYIMEPLFLCLELVSVYRTVQHERCRLPWHRLRQNGLCFEVCFRIFLFLSLQQSKSWTSSEDMVIPDHQALGKRLVIQTLPHQKMQLILLFFAIINYIYVCSGVIIEKLGWRYLFYFPGILSVLSGKHNSYTDINWLSQVSLPVLAVCLLCFFIFLASIV